MITLRIGIQTASLRQPLRQALRTAAELGAEAVELDARRELFGNELSDTAARQVRKILADSNLAVSAVAFRTRRGYDTPQDLDRRVEATKRAMTLAYRLGAPVVINRVGNPPRPSTDEEKSAVDHPRWQLLIEVLTDLGMYGLRAGARLAADTSGTSGEDLAGILDAIPEASLAVNPDPAALITGGHSPLAAVRSLGPAIAHVYARDAARDLAEGRGAEVPLGRGTADFPALLAALEELDYRGVLTIVRTEADDPVFEIEQAGKFLRSL